MGRLPLWGGLLSINSGCGDLGQPVVRRSGAQGRGRPAAAPTKRPRLVASGLLAGNAPPPAVDRPWTAHKAGDLEQQGPRPR